MNPESPRQATEETQLVLCSISTDRTSGQKLHKQAFINQPNLKMAFCPLPYNHLSVWFRNRICLKTETLSTFLYQEL